MIKSQMEVNSPALADRIFCISELASVSGFSGGKRLLGDQGVLQRRWQGPAWQPGLVVGSALHSGLMGQSLI